MLFVENLPLSRERRLWCEEGKKNRLPNKVVAAGRGMEVVKGPGIRGDPACQGLVGLPREIGRSREGRWKNSSAADGY
jgi:hypothetical protein